MHSSNKYLLNTNQAPRHMIGIRVQTSIKISFLTLSSQHSKCCKKEKSLVVSMKPYRHHFTSPELGAFINNAETTSATHQALSSSNILRSSCRIEWTVSVECPLLIQATDSLFYKSALCIHSWVFSCLIASDLCFHKQHFTDLLNMENWKVVVINQTPWTIHQFCMYLPKA